MLPLGVKVDQLQIGFTKSEELKNIQNNQRRNMIGNDDEFMDELANMLTDVIDLKDMPPPSEMQRHLIQVYNTTKDENEKETIRQIWKLEQEAVKKLNDQQD